MSASPSMTDFPSAHTGSGSELVLTSGRARVGKFIGVTLFALFWTGFSGFMWLMFFLNGEWFGVVFLSLFVLIGLAACVVAAFAFLALFNPQVRVSLDRSALALGDTANLTWELVGNASRVTDLKITLEGSELATYRRGTDTTTDRHVFRTIEIYHTDDPRIITSATGRTQLAIPPDTMHSFKASRNEVRWDLKVKGAIARWPDVDDSWTVEVRPLQSIAGDLQGGEVGASTPE